MNYTVTLNDEDYLRFNIFYANHSKAGRHSINMARMAFPVLSIAAIMIFFISGAKYGLIAAEAITLAIGSVIWCIHMPKMMEKNIQKNIDRIKADGKLPFHAVSEVEFQDSVIVERNAQGESHIDYKDIENVYLEKDYLYIFYSAVQALIIPCHCLGDDKERVVAYIAEKRG